MRSARMGVLGLSSDVRDRSSHLNPLAMARQPISAQSNTLTLVPDETIRAMIDDEAVKAHRARALNPVNPFVRGTAQNPDVFFQGREAANPFHLAVHGIVAQAMEQL